MDGGERLVWRGFLFFFWGGSGVFLVYIHLQRWAIVHVSEYGSVWNLGPHSLPVSSSRLKTRITFEVCEKSLVTARSMIQCATESRSQRRAK